MPTAEPHPKHINSGHQMRLNIILLTTITSTTRLFPLNPVLRVAIFKDCNNDDTIVQIMKLPTAYF